MWWGFLSAVAVALAVAELQVLRGKIEEPGWRLMWDPDTRAGNVFLFAASIVFVIFTISVFVATLLQ